MAVTEIQEKRRQDLLKACNHQEPDYVPIASIVGNALISNAGMTYDQIDNDEAAYDKMLDTFFREVYTDVYYLFIGGMPRTHEALGGGTETFISSDGVTEQHLQNPNKMLDNEYPRLIEDPVRFAKEVAFPRKYPVLFGGDREDAKRRLKTAVEETILDFVSGPLASGNTKIPERYGCVQLMSDMVSYPGMPLDMIFDYFRGFQPTLTDLRRRPAQVKAACDKLYECLCDKCENMEAYPFTSHMPHIPAYLSPKQFETFYWPYMKNSYTNIAKAGSKVVLSLEGSWSHLLDYFLELPKDSVVIMVDDDDIFEVNKRIGHHQTIMGGVNLNKLRLDSVEENIDYAKRVIDACAPGGGFIFGNDKFYSCKDDINPKLAEIHAVAHEYGKR